MPEDNAPRCGTGCCKNERDNPNVPYPQGLKNALYKSWESRDCHADIFVLVERLSEIVDAVGIEFVLDYVEHVNANLETFGHKYIPEKRAWMYKDEVVRLQEYGVDTNKLAPLLGSSINSQCSTLRAMKKERGMEDICEECKLMEILRCSKHH